MYTVYILYAYIYKYNILTALQRYLYFANKIFEIYSI